MHRYFGGFNAYLQLSEHRKFVDCQKDSACFQDALPSPIKVYVKQVLSPESYIVESEEVVEARNVFVKEMAVLASRRSVNN